MAYWADIFAQNPGEDMAALRHAAYRQFVLWRHGRLGTNIRRVIPSCVVVRIRDKFPSASAVYTGFQVSRLAWGTWSLCRPQPFRHASPVTSHQLRSWGWRGGSQSPTDAAGIFRHQHATSSHRFCVSHSAIHYISLNLNDVLVFLRNFHGNSIPVTGFLAVHPVVPKIKRQLLS